MLPAAVPLFLFFSSLCLSLPFCLTAARPPARKPITKREKQKKKQKKHWHQLLLFVSVSPSLSSFISLSFSVHCMATHNYGKNKQNRLKLEKEAALHMAPLQPAAFSLLSFSLSLSLSFPFFRSLHVFLLHFSTENPHSFCSYPLQPFIKSIRGDPLKGVESCGNNDQIDSPISLSLALLVFYVYDSSS